MVHSHQCNFIFLFILPSTSSTVPSYFSTLLHSHFLPFLSPPTSSFFHFTFLVFAFYFIADIDECAVPNECHQGCLNTNGSFLCTCLPGFLLSSDGTTCECRNDCYRYTSLENGRVCPFTNGTYSFLATDNCITDPGCSDICVHVDGTNTCSCLAVALVSYLYSIQRHRQWDQNPYISLIHFVQVYSKVDWGCKCIALEVAHLFLSFLWQS